MQAWSTSWELVIFLEGMSALPLSTSTMDARRMPLQTSKEEWQNLVLLSNKTVNASLCVHLLRSNRSYSADVVRTTLLFRYYPAWRYTDIVIVVVTEVQCPMNSVEHARSVLFGQRGEIAKNPA